MGTRVFLRALIALILYAHVSLAIYEDQVGLYDWNQQYIGKVKHAVFHTQKAGRKRVVVSTEENVIASLDLRRGAIFWRHVLGANDPVDHIDIGLGKYVITLSSEGGTVRAWNLPDGQMVWESVLPASAPSQPLLCVPAIARVGKDNLIIVSGGGYLHAISAFDGEVIWSKDFFVKSVEIQEIYQLPEDDIIYVLGYSGSSKIVTYEISAKKGEVLKQSDLLFPGRLSGETLHISNDFFVALDDSKSVLVLISFKKGVASFHQTHISDLVKDFSGKAHLLHTKYSDMFAVRLDSCIILVKIKGDDNLMVVERITHPASLSDALSLSEEQRAFAVVQQKESHISIMVKFDGKLDEVLKESIEVDSQRGLVEKVFINNYVRTDRSHGFRALLVMEDHSLLLVQQGEIVWSREDGLASIIDSTTSELPLEKGVSVAKVEHNLYEWLKGHLLKLKATLMLANPDDLAAIQNLRLKNSERNKMSRDHNGFRKLLVVFTRAGKVLALHTGDGRIVWSLLPSSFRSESCQHPTGLSIYQWQIPHHLAMDENPSVLVVGRCGPNSDAAGILSVVDSYSGKELRSLQLPHTIVHVMPLPFTDSKEQRLHLIFDSNNCAHLYPRTSDSMSVFHRELSNIYWYSVESEKGIMRGYSLHSGCNLDVADEYCFKTRRLWSIVFPLETEKIVTTTSRKSIEVVHTQAKTVGDQDMMYKYVSKNLVFVATVSPKASGDIGSAVPEESHLVAYIIDTVTGRIIHRVTHQGATGPVHAVFSENWVVYHYFNLRAHRHEMSVIEIYDQSRADNKDVLKLMFGKHNLTLPVSSYSWPEIVVKSQSYFFSHSVKAMAATMTAKGITSKQLLIGTIGDQILALDKRYLDPRRTANPSQSEREEGIIPLTDSLPIIPQFYVTHSLRVEGLRSIVSIPAKLESTTLVFSYGIDLFFTRIAPSRTYDSLTEDFNYALLLITIVALVAAIFVTWVLSEQKELREKWR